MSYAVGDKVRILGTVEEDTFFDDYDVVGLEGEVTWVMGEKLMVATPNMPFGYEFGWPVRESEVEPV